MDDIHSNHTDAVNFEKEYDQEVSFFLGTSDKPLSLLQEQQTRKSRSPGDAEDPGKREKRLLRRQMQVEERGGSAGREEFPPVYVMTVTAASDPNIAESSEQPVKRSPEKIMSAFDQTERLFREEFLSPDILSRAEKLGSESPVPVESRSDEVSPCRTPTSPTVGSGHLDNLVRMMEVLSVMKSENKTLKRKCAYLEDTKSLLQVQNEMLLAKETNGTRYQQKMRVMDYLNQSQKHERGPSEKKVAHKSRRRSRHRGTSESSDTGEVLSKREESPHPLKLHQRSQSVGSIEMVDLDLSTMTVQEQYRSKSAEKSSKHQFSRAAKTSKKFQAKWERVKKVFGGKPEQAAGREGSAISAEQLVKVNSRLKRKNKPPDLPHVHSDLNMSADPAGMDHLKPGDPSLSRSTIQLTEPPSPSSVQSEPPQSTDGFIDDSNAEDMATYSASPSYQSRSGRSRSMSSLSSEEGAEVEAAFKHQVEQSKTMVSNRRSSPYLTVQSLPRRKSSPTLSLRDQTELKKQIENSMFSSGGRRGDKDESHLRRSSSYKDRTQSAKPSDESDRPSPIKAAGKDTARKARAAWVRVKDIIHTRKDSLKRRNMRTMSAGDGLLEGYGDRDLSPGSPRGSPSDSEIAYNRRTSPLGRGTSPDSPRVSRKTKSKTAPRRARKSLQKAKSTSPSETPPHHRKRQSLANVAMSGATPDEMAAILGKKRPRNLKTATQFQRGNK